jgi:PTS system nitrogen regulatory IIA component
MPNIVGRFLAPSDVVLGLDVFDKTGALEAIATLLERHHHFKREPILSALWLREQIGATALPFGVAIPHACVEGISQPLMMLARTRLPIKFGAPNHETVSILCVIVVPEEHTDEHLQILATVSEMFSDGEFRRQLDGAADPAYVHRLVTQWQAA